MLSMNEASVPLKEYESTGAKVGGGSRDRAKSNGKGENSVLARYAKRSRGPELPSANVDLMVWFETHRLHMFQEHP